MKSNRLTLAHMAIAIVMGTAAVPSFALFGGGGGGIVYDPQNHVQTTISAVKSAASLVVQQKLLFQQILANKTEFLIQNGLADTPELQNLIGTSVNSAQQLQRDLRGGQQAFNNLQNAFGASQYSNWNQFASNISVRKEAGDKQATMLLDSAFSADEQIKKSYAANRAILGKLNQIHGPTEGLQATVNAVSVLIDQNSALLYTLSSQAKNEGQKTAVEAKKTEQQEKSMAEYLDQSMRAYESDRGQILQGGTRASGVGPAVPPSRSSNVGPLTAPSSSSSNNVSPFSGYVQPSSAPSGFGPTPATRY